MNYTLPALLITAPFIAGLNRPLAWAAWALVMVAALLFRSSVSPQAALARWGIAAAGIAALFAFALPLLQLAGGLCAAIPSPWPCVTDTEQSWLSVTFALMIFLWALLLCSNPRPTANQLLMTLAIAGSLQAIYALLTFFLGITPLFLEGVLRHTDVPTGGFPNRNHLAAFLYICIFATLALVLRLPADTGTGRAGRWRMLLDQRVFWRIAVVLMVLALIATRSRAGNAVFLIGLLAGFAWLFAVRWRGEGKRARLGFMSLVIGSVLLLDAVLIGTFAGLDKLEQRLSDTSLASEQRDDVTATLLANPELFTAGGHGATSFLQAFEPRKPQGLTKLYDQAHNDYLQILVERGWAGAVLFALALGLILRKALAPGRRKNESGRPELQFAIVASTTALLVHASVEFVTQIPAIWLAWLTVVAPALHRDDARNRRASGHGRPAASGQNAR
jgi:putative inorganic carbon (HCO3(-)) transporter